MAVQLKVPASIDKRLYLQRYAIRKLKNTLPNDSTSIGEQVCTDREEQGVLEASTVLLVIVRLCDHCQYLKDGFCQH